MKSARIFSHPTSACSSNYEVSSNLSALSSLHNFHSLPSLLFQATNVFSVPDQHEYSSDNYCFFPTPSPVFEVKIADKNNENNSAEDITEHIRATISRSRSESISHRRSPVLSSSHSQQASSTEHEVANDVVVVESLLRLRSGSSESITPVNESVECIPVASRTFSNSINSSSLPIYHSIGDNDSNIHDNCLPTSTSPVAIIKSITTSNNSVLNSSPVHDSLSSAVTSNTVSSSSSSSQPHLPFKFRLKDKSAAMLLTNLNKVNDDMSNIPTPSNDTAVNVACDYTDLLGNLDTIRSSNVAVGRIDSLSSSDNERNRNKRSSLSISSDDGDYCVDKDNLLRKKYRGKYNCSKCGKPKDGHVCETLSSVSTGVQCEAPIYGSGIDKFMGKIIFVTSTRKVY